jgi:hypothetical protein
MPVASGDEVLRCAQDDDYPLTLGIMIMSHGLGMSP